MIENDIRDRVKILRKHLNLSQTEFASKLSLERSAISLIERKQRNVTERSIKDICREFNVNEQWIRTGKGNMFSETPNSVLEQLGVQYDMNELEIIFLSKYLNLSKQSRQCVIEFFKSCFSESSRTYISATQEKETEITNEDLKILPSTIQKLLYDTINHMKFDKENGIPREKMN